VDHVLGLSSAVKSRKYPNLAVKGNFALSDVEAYVLTSRFDWKLEINKSCIIRYHLDSVMWPMDDNLTPNVYFCGRILSAFLHSGHLVIYDTTDGFFIDLIIIIELLAISDTQLFLV